LTHPENGKRHVCGFLKQFRIMILFSRKTDLEYKSLYYKELDRDIIKK